MDATQVLSASADMTVRLWDRFTGEVVHRLEGHRSTVTSVAMDEVLVITGSYDTTARLWDRATGVLIRTLEGHRAGVLSVAMDGTHMLTGSADKTACLVPHSWAATARTCAKDITMRGSAARQLHATILRCGWPALHAALPALLRLDFATQRVFFHQNVATCPEAGDLVALLVEVFGVALAELIEPELGLSALKAATGHPKKAMGRF